jgi:hypothetical protein
LPSSRSTFTHKVRDGGALAALQEDRVGSRILADDFRKEVDLVILAEKGAEYSGPAIAGLSFEEIRDLGDPLLVADEIQKRLHELPETVQGEAIVVDNKPLLERYRLFLTWMREHIPEENRVSILPLYESLKMRVITKGTAQYNFLSHWLQRFLHDQLRRHPCFQLIGRPITAEVIRQRIGFLQSWERYLSGDFKDATNEMKGWVCEYMLKSILEVIQVPQIHQEYLYKTLTHHLVQNPSNINEYRQQVSAQLMGSILSFPILCLVNASCARWAMEVSERRKLSLRAARLLINGDDFICPLHKDMRSSWRTIVTLVGWTESQGKSFFSSKFLMMNSALFVPNYEWGSMDHVKKIKCGLLAGKGKTGTGDLNTENVGDAARQLLADSPDEWRNRALSLFIRNQRKVLDKAGIRSWFVPRFLGGLGLPGCPDDKDRKIAKTILFNAVDIPKYVPDVPYRLHNEVLDKIPDLQTQYNKVSVDDQEYQDCESNYSRLYRDLCVEIFLTRPLSHYFDENHKEKDPSVYINRKIQKQISWARERVISGPGLTDFDLVLRQAEQMFPVFYAGDVVEEGNEPPKSSSGLNGLSFPLLSISA